MHVLNTCISIHVYIYIYICVIMFIFMFIWIILSYPLSGIRRVPLLRGLVASVWGKSKRGDVESREGLERAQNSTAQHGPKTLHDIWSLGPKT